MRVLLLNASWEPLAVVPTRRAFTLVLRDKAELVEIAETPLRCASGEWPSPSVVRLVRYVRVPRRTPPMTRRGVIARDRGRCAYCTNVGDTIDHIVPKSRGGSHTWLNCISSCSACNFKKDARTPEEARMPLRFAPTVPAARGLYAVDAAWVPYLARTRAM